MTEKLKPNQDQQEDRAARAKSMAEVFGQQPGVSVTFKGEAIEVHKGSKHITITANADESFTVEQGPTHIGADELLKYVRDA